MSDARQHSDFEQVLNRSFDLAVELQHEYVTQEHLLYACLEQPTLTKTLTNMGVSLESLRTRIWTFLTDATKHSLMPDVRFQPKYTHTMLTVVKQAKAQSLFLGRSSIDLTDLVMAMFNTKESWAAFMLQQEGVTKQTLQDQLTSSQSVDQQVVDRDQALMVLAQYAVNLNKKARAQKIDPLIGRRTEVDHMVHVLCRKNKNNPLLVGSPGVGKTQIVEGLAKLIQDKQVPELLYQKEIWSLDVSALVAGTKFRGDFEERMKNLIQAIKSLPDVILFVDEIHMILGAGSGGGQSSMDVANILKPALGRGEIRCVGATTQEEFRKHFEKDRALLRRFQKLDVAEPSMADAKQIVKGVLHTFGKYHGVTYDSSTVDASVELSVKFMQNKHLPDKALDLIDHAGAAAKLKGKDQVQLQDIQQAVADQTRISLDMIRQEQRSETPDIQALISHKLFGQDHAVNMVSDQVYMSLSGLRENNKPQGSFLFVGPSGVGKTELAKLLADSLNYAFVRFDMSEFQEKHSLSRLIGSPPGYVGYADGAAGSGALINALEQSPQCVLLIDEVEKAHPDVSQLFLQVMDAGVLTSANQKTIHMNNVILIFTSNLGAQELDKNPLGFGITGKTLLADTEAAPAVKQFFAPEFRNRLDAVINFKPLANDHMRQILDKYLTNLNHMCAHKKVHITLDPEAKNWLVQKGFDPVMGARPLQRCVDEHIKKPMAREMLFGKLQQGGRVLVTVDADNKLKLDFLQVCVNSPTLWDAELTDWNLENTHGVD
jgi:ATP-dependent Clp protease ATP-binding subunit ClpA